MNPLIYLSPLPIKKIHELVKQQINLNVKIKTNDDIDLTVNNYTRFVQSAAQSSTSKLQPSFHNPLLPKYIRSIIIEKRRA